VLATGLDAGSAVGFIGLGVCVAACVAAVEVFLTGSVAAGNEFDFDVELTLIAESFAAAGFVAVAGFNVFC
jgi:hypothetical protein